MKIGLKNLVSRQRAQLKRTFRAFSHEWKYRRLSTVGVTIENLRVSFDTSDAYSKRWWFPRYLDGRIHEPAVTHLAVRLAKHAQWFADVGANLGWYTCIVASFLPGGRVDAFEMNPALCEILERNVHLNHLDAHVHNVAITADSREVSFLTGESMGTYIPKTGSHAAGRTLQVQGRTLDEFCSANQGRGLVKIDVEGAEMDVLSGMGFLLKRPDLDLLIELHPWAMEEFGSSPSRILEVLQGHGYQVRELRGLRRESADIVAFNPSLVVGNTMIWATRSTDVPG